MSRRRRLTAWEWLAAVTIGARSILRDRTVRIEYPTHIYYSKQDEWERTVRHYGGVL